MESKYYKPFSDSMFDVIDKISNKYNLYTYLYCIRKSRYTQEQFAALSGLSTSTISRLENGENISLSNLLKYVHALGLELTITAK